MIRGIIALFASGVMTNPMVLLGILLGGVCYSFMDGHQIFQLYKMPLFYGIALLLAMIYVLGFRRVYTTEGTTDWFETFLAVLGAFLRFIFASLLMLSFVSLFDMGDVKKMSSSGF